MNEKLRKINASLTMSSRPVKKQKRRRGRREGGSPEVSSVALGNTEEWETLSDEMKELRTALREVATFFAKKTRKAP